MPDSNTSTGPGSESDGSKAEQPRLIGDIPLRVARAVVRQDGHPLAVRPRAEPRANGRGQMFDYGRSEHLEKEILVGLLLEPRTPRLLLEFRPCADRDEHDGVRPGFCQRAMEPRTGKRDAFRPDRRRRAARRLRPDARRPTAVHVRRTRPRPVGQFERATVEHVSAREIPGDACTRRGRRRRCGAVSKSSISPPLPARRRQA
jgi:hypothetical protein